MVLNYKLWKIMQLTLNVACPLLNYWWKMEIKHLSIIWVFISISFKVYQVVHVFWNTCSLLMKISTSFMQHIFKEKFPISLATCTYHEMANKYVQVLAWKYFLKQLYIQGKLHLTNRKLLLRIFFYNNILTDALLCNDKKNLLTSAYKLKTKF